MENRRLFLFLLYSMTFLWLWSSFLEPPPQDPLAAAPDVSADANSAAAADNESGTDENSAAARPLEFAEHPQTTVSLGSSSPDSGFASVVTISSTGAAIDGISLNSAQFHDLIEANQPAQILGNNNSLDRTFSTAVSRIDALLQQQDQTLEQTNWKLADQSETPTESRVVFEFDSPDGTIRLRKTFSLPRTELTGPELQAALRDQPQLYTLQLTLEIENLTDSPQVVDYELQGPTGMLLENQEHTFKYRDIHLEFAGGKDAVTLNIATLQGYCDDLDRKFGRKAGPEELTAGLREDHEWVIPPRYAGIDVQFFAAMIAPVLPEGTDPEKGADWIERTYPMLVGEDLRETRLPFPGSIIRGIGTALAGREIDPRLADLSFRLATQPLELAAGESVSHSYALFAGPKRRELLDPEPFAAGQVLNYGWFGPVARIMHSVLDFFYNGLGLPYVLSIICLTVLVRGMMFPLSRKQAIMAARQKELQPHLKALKEKYKDDQQKFARAQMDLWKKHGINPLSGCLPLFFQMPIFIGLYTALNSAVDLRGQSFLWISNLAAPDALFRLPLRLPLGLGYDFSILPLCTVALFLTQQKMFMPPAQDEQQAMQYKMMNYMTGIMGIFFWHQPAGLSVYFIASSLWSITERKLLGSSAKPAPTSGVEVIIPDDPPAGNGKSRRSENQSVEQEDKPQGFWGRLMEAAEEAQRKAESERQQKAKKGKRK